MKAALVELISKISSGCMGDDEILKRPRLTQIQRVF
jgi:hypothetical protein